MSQISKYIKSTSIGVVTLIATFSLSPVIVGAVDGATTTKEARESVFCTNLTANITKIDANISGLEAKLATSRTTRDQAITNDNIKWDQQLKDNRAKWDQQRQDNFVKLEARAKTPAQLTAVKTYETSILNAINTRRSNNDIARTTYRSAIQSVLGAQRTTINGQLTTFGSSVSSTEATTRASCLTTPSNGPAARIAFQASLKSAREKYAANRKSDIAGRRIEYLVTNRKASIKTNEATFKTATSTAREALKTVFGNNA